MATCELARSWSTREFRDAHAGAFKELIDKGPDQLPAGIKTHPIGAVPVLLEDDSRWHVRAVKITITGGSPHTVTGTVARGDAEAVQPAMRGGAATRSSSIVWTDGSCDVEGMRGRGGWAALVQAGGTIREISGGADTTTHNRMELTAICGGAPAAARCKSRCARIAPTSRSASTRTGTSGGCVTALGRVQMVD